MRYFSTDKPTNQQTRQGLFDFKLGFTSKACCRILFGWTCPSHSWQSTLHPHRLNVFLRVTIVSARKRLVKTYLQGVLKMCCLRNTVGGWPAQAPSSRRQCSWHNGPALQAGRGPHLRYLTVVLNPLWQHSCSAKTDNKEGVVQLMSTSAGWTQSNKTYRGQIQSTCGHYFRVGNIQ